MKSAGYVRVSSHEQIDGTSLKFQEEQIRSYANLHNIELVDVLIDAGVSGGKPLAVRPEGSKLTEMVERGDIEGVIIVKLDRAFRSASDCLNNVESWDKRKVSLRILNLGGSTLDTSTPMGKFFLTSMAAAAELERNMINERCNEGRKARRAEGKRIGEVPYGWTLADDGRTLIENPEEQEALDLIYSMNRSGHSLRNIAAELNRRGYSTKKGGIWSHASVQTILLRRAA